jgi:hypothetical protein
MYICAGVEGFHETWVTYSYLRVEARTVFPGGDGLPPFFLSWIGKVIHCGPDQSHISCGGS